MTPRSGSPNCLAALTVAWARTRCEGRRACRWVNCGGQCCCAVRAYIPPRFGDSPSWRTGFSSLSPARTCTYPMVRSVPTRNQLGGPTKMKLRTEADADPFFFGNLDGAPARVSDHCVLFAHVFRQRCVPRWSTLGSRDHQCRREEGASSS